MSLTVISIGKYINWGLRTLERYVKIVVSWQKEQEHDIILVTFKLTCANFGHRPSTEEYLKPYQTYKLSVLRK